MKSAVQYVANNSGFVTTDDEKNHLLLEILTLIN